MPNIKVDADVGAVLRSLEEVERRARRVADALDDGKLVIDTSDAQKQLDELEAGARDLAGVLDEAVRSGSDLTGVDFDAVADSLDSATQAAKGLERAIGEAGATGDESLGGTARSAVAVKEALDGAASSTGDLDKRLDAVGKRSGSGASSAAKNARDAVDNLARAAKVQRALANDGVSVSQGQAGGFSARFSEWARSGARGTRNLRGKSLDEWLNGGWRGYSLDEVEARRHRARVLQSLGVNLPQRERQVLEESPASGDAGGGSSQKVGGRWDRVAGALGGVVGGMASGGDGGMWGALGGLAGAGVGGVVGGPAGLAVGALAGKVLGGIGSAIDAGIARAGQEGAAYTDLRQALGATKVDFDDLRGSVRHFTDGLGLAYNESARLAQQFVRTAGAGAGDIGREVGTAAGFGRSYGMGPDATVQFFAAMRQYGQTAGERDSKRLALQIAEAVQRGGTSTKMDEVLSAVASFTQTASRRSLSEANAGAYASFMASLTGLSHAGLKSDPGSAASMMGAADEAMRKGGNFGEASKNFSLGLWQRKMPGFTAFDMDYLNEQGAFGTISRAFGRDSAAYKFAQSRGDKAKMAQYDRWAASGGDRSVLAMQMQALAQQFGGNTDGFRKAIQSHFGLGAGQASALYQAYRADPGLGHLEANLRGSGVNIGKLDPKQIATLAELSATDGGGLRKQADRLLGMTGGDALSVDERARLNKALDTGSTEDLRRVVLGLSAVRDSTIDEGARQRQIQADMNNAVQKLATELIPLTMTVKEGIVALVQKLAPQSEFAVRAEREAEDRRKNEALAISGVTGYDPAIQQLRAVAKSGKTPQEREAAERSLAQLVAQRDAAVDRARAQVSYNSSDSYRTWAAGLSRSDGGGAPLNEDAGSKVKPVPGMVRTKRTNNAGAIEYGDFAIRHGAKGSDGRFAIFDTPEAGSKALDSLLQIYGRQGLNTVKKILSKYAPANENRTKDYIDFVSKRMGVGADDQLNMDDPRVRAAMGQYIAQMEGSKKTFKPYWLDVGRSGRWDDPGLAGRYLPITGSKESRLPEAALRQPGPAPAAGAQKVVVTGELVVVDQHRRRTGQTVQVRQGDGAPVPAGVAR